MRIRFSIIIFVGSLIAMTTACTVGWERFVKNHIYNCTDDVPLDYLQPGQWIHHPAAVAHVAGGRSMSEQDTILQGWSVLGLWGLWSSLVLGSVVISFLLARLPCSMNTVKARLLISFLLPLVFGSCATGDKRVSQETAIQEAVFGYQMAQRHADTYFLAVGPKNSDPSAAFMRRFANHQTPVRKDSASRFVKGEGLFDKTTGKRGVSLTVGELKWISDTEVEATGGYYSGELAGGLYTYTIRKLGTTWRIVNERQDVAI